MRREHHLGAIVANRVLPSTFTRPAAATSARKLERAARGELADRVGAAIDASPDTVGDVLTEVATRFHDVAVVAAREAERRAELDVLSPLLVSAPVLDRDVNDIADLRELAGHLS